jgi:hypothetical protein
MNKMKRLTIVSMIALLATLLVVNGVTQAETYPTFEIQGVTADEEVTIVTANFPAGYDFEVRMGLFGTKGVDGILVGTVNAGEGGSLKWTAPIPAGLQSESLIAIRLESTFGGYYAYNWFSNADFGNHTGGVAIDESTAEPSATPTPVSGGMGGPVTVYYGIPTISILDINEDEDVTIKTNNFPADKDFQVLMGKIGTRGVGGILVTTINSGDGGSFEATFDIPAALKGDYQIAIRLQTADNYFYSYDWFYNSPDAAPSPGEGTPLPGYTGIPTFSISSVVEDSKVTILTNNIPAGFEWKVLMGKMWTKGVDGVEVATISSAEGGAFSETFSIPNALKSEAQIAIRLESTVGGFYAYNWFYNSTSP